MAKRSCSSIEPRRIRPIIAGLLLLATPALAHPGVGIVMDSRGSVYYTDLKQVWRITPDGKKSVVVPNVHTHELCVDAEDNLYGEHLWYEGDRTGKWGHRVWRLSSDGKLSDVIPAREGFLTDYSFVRDGAGNMYWADRGSVTRIRKRGTDGRVTDLAAGGFNNVRWMAAGRDGTVYLVDYRGKSGKDLVRISPGGRVETMVQGLFLSRFSIFQTDGLHDVMGLAADKDGNVFVAVAADRTVRKVTSSGTVTVAVRSTVPWSPSGVLPARDGDLWVLEYNIANAVRVRRIRPDGSARVF